ncbi:TPA: hypothetical protein ACTXXA_000777 [Legionella anisa]
MAYKKLARTFFTLGKEAIKRHPQRKQKFAQKALEYVETLVGKKSLLQLSQNQKEVFTLLKKCSPSKKINFPILQNQ